jgi:ADP-dependent NAD(P)H-hydrate dehydratase / NAD(P)H-hydrate epimerase
MKILTASQMREVDLLITERYGVPSLVLMENAGAGVVCEIEKAFGSLHGRPVAVFCGKGNNGGDGFVVARHLMMKGCQPQVLLFASPEDLRGDAQINFEILRKMGVPVLNVSEREFSDEKLGQLFTSLHAGIVVDALLGTGIRLPVSSFLAKVIHQLNALSSSIVAVDVPSGLDSESLTFESKPVIAPTATLTVTFTAPKPSNIFSPGDQHCGKWVVIPIGTPEEVLEDPRFWLNYVSRSEAAGFRRKLNRSPEAHKGDFGHVLVIAGSLGKTGAACMTAQSALRVGAGLVTLAVPAVCLPIVASQSLEIMTEPLEATEVGTVSTKAFDYGRTETLLQGKDVIALGPGLGGHLETVEFVRRLVSQTRLPLILDADGINAFAGKMELINGEDRTLVLTPHPGEFARLLGISAESVRVNRIELCRKFAQEHRVHLILKGHRTIYASPSGQLCINSTGNPGMATGGSGDVLTGMLAGLVGQSLSGAISLEEAIILGVYLHGLAGDAARKTLGEHSLMASDIMANISGAFLDLGPAC